MTHITKIPFGTTAEGETVSIYTLENRNMRVRVLDYGGAIVTCEVPDRTGDRVDVVLGYDTLADYEKQDKYIGPLIGRCAGRIANARFTLNGQEYHLLANDGSAHLHGGARGFDKRLWQAEIDGEVLRLSYVSPDGEEGYPGTLRCAVSYSLDEAGALTLDYRAKSDADTVVTLTNHAYFNLNGAGSGDVMDHFIRIFADEYTPGDEASLTTGERRAVAGTPMDLREWTAIGAHIDDDYDDLRFAGGYDHNWVVRGEGGTLRAAASAAGPRTGVRLDVSTTQEGLVFYTGNYLDGVPGKDGARYDRRGGFCLETQCFPNAMANPAFPQPVLRAGELYHETTVFRFSVSGSL